jgi:16S rRNA (cytosine1402-N4)-methyltransferase
MAGQPSEFRHEPVMLDEIVRALAEVPPGVVVDATVGGGGHAAAVLASRPDLEVLGLDQDDDALAAATERLAGFGARARLRRARFDRLADVVGEEGAGDRVTGVLFDLGVSSPQLDRADRGFSFRHDAPLDMRMDRTAPLTAADVVNTYDEDRLAHLLATYGDERFARRVAHAIVGARPVASTAELADLVRTAIPAATRRRGGHPARRTFQALRIEVNDELAVLERALVQAIDVLAPGGRCLALSYHSGEDRLVKAAFRHAADGGCQCPPQLPCRCGAVRTVRLVRRGAAKPAAAEAASNPRAESARLRIVEKLEVAP